MPYYAICERQDHYAFAIFSPLLLLAAGFFVIAAAAMLMLRRILVDISRHAITIFHMSAATPPCHCCYFLHAAIAFHACHADAFRRWRHFLMPRHYAAIITCY